MKPAEHQKHKQQTAPKTYRPQRQGGFIKLNKTGGMLTNGYSIRKYFKTN
jgi:hypothetical protein